MELTDSLYMYSVLGDTADHQDQEGAGLSVERSVSMPEFSTDKEPPDSSQVV